MCKTCAEHNPDISKLLEDNELSSLGMVASALAYGGVLLVASNEVVIKDGTGLVKIQGVDVSANSSNVSAKKPKPN